MYSLCCCNAGKCREVPKTVHLAMYLGMFANARPDVSKIGLKTDKNGFLYVGNTNCAKLREHEKRGAGPEVRQSPNNKTREPLRL